MACEGTSANGITGIPDYTGAGPPPGGPPPPPHVPPPGPPPPPPGAAPPPPPGPDWAGADAVAGAGTGTCPVVVVVVVVLLVETMFAWVFITCAEEAYSNTRDGRRFLRKVYRSSVWALRINQYLVYFNL